MTKIFFLGTPQIAVPSLERLAGLETVEIVGVGVFPDKPVGRKQVLTANPVKRAAQQLGLPVYELRSKNELVQTVSQLDFDLGIVIAFGMIFPATILPQPDQANQTSFAPKTFVNVHFSSLPEWRGASPVQAAILSGQATTGISWQIMSPPLDAGDILWQKQYDITEKNTAEIWAEFAEKTAESFPQFIHQWQTSQLTNQPQDEAAATFCGKFSKSDGQVFPQTETAAEIERKWRAFTPWPGVFVETKYGNVKILGCNLQSDPGTGCPLDCAAGTSLWLETVQLAGKQKTAAKDLLNGYPDIFGH